jgi:hypothetical protein
MEAPAFVKGRARRQRVWTIGPGLRTPRSSGGRGWLFDTCRICDVVAGVCVEIIADGPRRCLIEFLDRVGSHWRTGVFGGHCSEIVGQKGCGLEDDPGPLVTNRLVVAEASYLPRPIGSRQKLPPCFGTATGAESTRRSDNCAQHAYRSNHCSNPGGRLLTSLNCLNRLPGTLRRTGTNCNISKRSNTTWHAKGSGVRFPSPPPETAGHRSTSLVASGVSREINRGEGEPRLGRVRARWPAWSSIRSDLGDAAPPTSGAGRR